MTPHRGLPLPAALTLSNPTQQPSNSLGSHMPQQWQSPEEASRTAILAKMEEDRRKTEEERTKQEQLRMDMRKLDFDFMREAFQMGIPPAVIPILFAGGGALKGAGGEWLNEFYAQQMGLQQQQQQQQQQQAQRQQAQQQQAQQHPHQSHQMPPRHSPGPDRPSLRREDRVIGPQSFGQPAQPQQQHMPPPGAAGMPPQQGPPQPAGYMPTYPLSGIPAAPQSRAPIQQQARTPQSQSLQINTKDMHPHQQPPILPGMPGQMIGTPISNPHGQPMQSVPHPPIPIPPPAQEPTQQQPGLFFHHWVPPTGQSAGMATPVQTTASPQRQLDSPFSHHPPSNQLTGPDYVSSPKKRKTATTQSQQQTSSGPPFSPPFHTASLPTATTPSRARRGHSRHRSETVSSARGYEPYSKPSTRNRRSTGESPHPESNVLGSQLPPVSSAGDNGGGGNGGPHHPREQEHQRQDQQRQEQERQDQQRQDQQRQDQQRQQSVPPPQIGRPYSAGPDFRRDTYPPSQPSRSEGGGENRSKSGNGRD